MKIIVCKLDEFIIAYGDDVNITNDSVGVVLLNNQPIVEFMPDSVDVYDVESIPEEWNYYRYTPEEGFVYDDRFKHIPNPLEGVKELVDILNDSLSLLVEDKVL